MKTQSILRSCLLTAFTAFLSGSIWAQQEPSGRTRAPARLNPIITAPADKAVTEPLMRFDLDFPGGTPQELVKAIEKGMGRPVNVIVPADTSGVTIPELRLRSVTVPELFDALGQASTKTINYVSGFTDYGGGPRRETVQQAQVNYGFNRGPGSSLTDDAVWYFFDRTKLSLPQNAKTCRFWQLSPYLENYKIEDITTAIQTGYRLLGETAPAINFHKDTKLLIAVGDANNLSLIDSALRELNSRPPTGPRSSTPDAAIPRAANPGEPPIGR